MVYFAWRSLVLGPIGRGIDERYVSCVRTVLTDWFPGYLVLVPLVLLQLSLICLPRLHLTLTDRQSLDRVLAERMDCALIPLSLFKLSKTGMVTVHPLVHLGLIYLFYLTWKYFRWVDGGMFVDRLAGIVRLIVCRLAMADLVSLSRAGGCRGRLPHAPRSATVDIFLIYLDQTAVGTGDPVSRGEDLDIANRQDLVVHIVGVDIPGDVFLDVLVDDGFNYLLGYGYGRAVSHAPWLNGC